MSEQTNAQALPRARAWPTKSLFISMLIKDVDLVAAITDLADNSLDGARRINRDGNYDGLFVRICFSADDFSINDNCGGIDLDTARDYAFRFGRHVDRPTSLHLVGEFGVGMKRALFKIGNHFKVESTTARSRFVVEMPDVNQWSKLDETMQDWEFEFTVYEPDLPNVVPTEIGTRIIVCDLDPGIAEQFRLESFQRRLIRTLCAAHQDALLKHLAITVNGFPLQAQSLVLKVSSFIKPAYQEITFRNPGKRDLLVKMYAGVADSSPKAAGWYVFCNGRLVLEADQTDRTVWGEMADSEGSVSIPRIHNQFARFRGFVFFDCDDPGLLPWNTTKNDVDADSEVFKNVREQMVLMTRPVIDFLNELDREKAQDDRPRERAVTSAPSAALPEIPERDVFEAVAAPPVRLEERMGSISYKRPYQQIEKLKMKLEAASNREVGEKSFDYVFKYECE